MKTSDVSLVLSQIIQATEEVIESAITRTRQEERSKIYAICYEVSKHLGDDKEKLRIIGEIQAAIKQLD